MLNTRTSWFNGLFPFVYHWALSRRSMGRFMEEVLVGSVYLPSLTWCCSGSAAGRSRQMGDSAGLCVCSQMMLGSPYTPDSHSACCKMDLHPCVECVNLLGQRTVGMNQLQTECGNLSSSENIHMKEQNPFSSHFIEYFTNFQVPK